MKRTQKAFFLATVMATIFCPPTSAYDFMAKMGSQEGYFNVIERGVCEITYADSVRVDGVDFFNTEKKYSGELALPYSVEHEGVEYYIARIGDHAFQDCTGLTKIDIRYICEEIGRDAFTGCTNLREIITGDATTDAPIQPSGTMPILYIDTKNGEPITSKTEYVNATYRIENANEYNIGPLPLQIRGRGNSSWRGEKKPYKLKLDAKAKLLGMKNNRHWALINGNTWPRIMAGFELGNRLGMTWNPSSRPVEVVLNGDYIGLYLLMETVRTDKNRVNIKEQPDMCTNNDSLYGGWLVEIDNYSDERQMIVPECKKWQMRVTWHTPEELSYKQREWLRNEFTQMNADIYSSVKDDALLASHIDIEAMARFFIAQEVMDNPDGFHGSFFLHKPYGNPSLWTAGPLWDINCMEREKTDYTFLMKVSYGFTPHLIGELLKYGNFRDEVNRQWRHFHPTATDWIHYIDETCAPAKYSAADEANNARWPSGSYKGLEEKVERTKYWYQKNVEWFDAHLPEPTTGIADSKSFGKSAVIYNLQGIPLDVVPHSPGIFIINGKKVVIAL